MIDDKDKFVDDEPIGSDDMEEINDLEDVENLSIEISDEDLDDIEEIIGEKAPVKSDDNDIILSKHTIEGKHSLKHDSIFKGKKEDPLSEEEYDVIQSNENFEVDKGSNYWFESIDNENYIRQKKVRERVYEVLSNNTEMNFLNNRRKPSKSDFNNYYHLLKTNLKEESFTNIEIFNELAVYFSDNLFNMFKLLDNKWRNMIITELQDHIGKQPYSNEVKNRNIHEGTEIEFEWVDGDKLIIITGIVIETDYENSQYKVDSYENIYDITIENITKILNNTKFKYNLNRLNNIDFL